jgi:hypothetical protein
MVEHGVDWSVLGSGHMAGSCEHGNGPSGFINCREFFWLSEELLAPEEGLCWVVLVPSFLQNIRVQR